ncbi:MAG: DUF1460 domain-containing protein [Bacteroides sp.]|nr:DUF1460 domain-containing protein [Bacteroides sp.]
MRLINKWIICAWCAIAFAWTAQAQDNESLVITNALKYLDVPYVAHTLEVNEEEDLVINTDEVDCTTFVEYVLAESMTPMVDGTISEGAFADNVIKIRYRNAKIDGYTSRLHYIAEWATSAVKNGILEDVAAANSPYVKKVDLHFMSSHPQSYKHLANSPENVAKMKEIEASLNGKEFHYVPKDKLPHNGLPWIKNGDVICLTTSVDGLDVSHLGFAFYVEGKLSLLHASYSDKKVVVSKVSLAQMLNRSDSLTGIRVLRLKK